MSYALSEINSLPASEFIRVVGPVFEHSPWVAESVANDRPFSDVEALHRTMCAAVQTAELNQQMSLIRAHPDLVGRAVLTTESLEEQRAAGLMELSAEEAALFRDYNQAYAERFGFPFIICARLNKKEAILAAFPKRLQNSAEDERLTALVEIDKIAGLRLADLIQE